LFLSVSICVPSVPVCIVSRGCGKDPKGKTHHPIPSSCDYAGSFVSF
jgi:hypothetical protein